MSEEVPESTGAFRTKTFTLKRIKMYKVFSFFKVIINVCESVLIDRCSCSWALQTKIKAAVIVSGSVVILEVE